MSDYIPPEIICEILLRLPVKSLCRFALVSKAWFSLITAKSFISSHLHHTTTSTTTTTSNSNHFLLLRRYTKEDKQEHYTLHNQPDRKTDPSQFMYSFGLPPVEFDLPIKTQVGYFRVVGSCDGLICLFDDYFRDIPVIVLWNPSIHKYVTLPIPSVKPTNPHMVVLGFGRDMLSNDYKVVRIVYRAMNQLVGFEASPDVEVYSLEKRVWRRIMGAQILCNITQFMWSHAYVNGSSYWIAWKDDGRTNLVLSFDMGREVFREISLPQVLSREPASELMVSAYRESLAVLEYHKEPFAAYCNVWVMKEYGVSESWTNLYSIHLVSGVDRAVGFTKNDEILMKKTGEVLMLKADEQLVLYDPGTRLVMNLGIYGTAGSFRADKYVESLVLLEARDGILEEGSSQLVAE